MGDISVVKKLVEVGRGGDGEWRDLDCGCRYTLGTDGWLYVMACDDHEWREARKMALEALADE